MDRLLTPPKSISAMPGHPARSSVPDPCHPTPLHQSSLDRSRLPEAQVFSDCTDSGPRPASSPRARLCTYSEPSPISLACLVCTSPNPHSSYSSLESASCLHLTSLHPPPWGEASPTRLDFSQLQRSEAQDQGAKVLTGPARTLFLACRWLPSPRLFL